MRIRKQFNHQLHRCVHANLHTNENSKHIHVTTGTTVHKFVGYTLNNHAGFSQIHRGSVAALLMNIVRTRLPLSVVNSNYTQKNLVLFS